MFLPNWLYALLPYLYLIVGAIVAVRMDSPVGIGAGIILMISGALVWKMRADYRRELAEMFGRKKRRSILQ